MRQQAHIEVSAQTVPAPSTAKRPCRNRLPVPTFICTLIELHHPTFEVTDMLDNLFKSFDGLLKEKHSLSAKADQLARNERQLVEKLSRALAGSGYRVVPVSDAGSVPGRAGGKMRGRKRLQCPKCERTFAHPLPMSRHLKATHGVTVGGKKKGRRQTA
jgi:uncharacterized C2H2 Zn-finger protein